MSNPIPQAELDKLASQLNFTSFTDDQSLIDAANELASPALTAEREAEIAASLPRGYTQKVNATAQESEDKILVPKIFIINAVKVKQGPEAGDWQFGVAGKKQRRPKKDVAVGFHVYTDNVWATVVKLLYLWTPDKG